jgi:hypothetical protein
MALCTSSLEALTPRIMYLWLLMRLISLFNIDGAKIVIILQIPAYSLTVIVPSIKRNALSL